MSARFRVRPIDFRALTSPTALKEMAQFTQASTLTGHNSTLLQTIPQRACLQELGLVNEWVSELIFSSLFISFMIWSFSPFFFKRKRFYTAVLFSRLLVVLVGGALANTQAQGAGGLGCAHCWSWMNLRHICLLCNQVICNTWHAFLACWLRSSVAFRAL